MDQVLQARSMPDLIRFEIDGSMHICVLVGILQVAGVSGLLLSCVHVLQLVHHGPLSNPPPPCTPPPPLRAVHAMVCVYAEYLQIPVGEPSCLAAARQKST